MNDSVWRRRLGLVRIAHAVFIGDVVTVAGCRRFLGPYVETSGLSVGGKGVRANRLLPQRNFSIALASGCSTVDRSGCREAGPTSLTSTCNANIVQ